MRIGIDLGGSHVAVGLISEEGKILIKKQADILKKYKEEGRVQKFIVDTILQKIDEILEESGLNKEFITQIGIATPGIFENGCILNAVNLGIEELAIENKIKFKYDLKIKGDNDVKCAAIAEQKYGSLKGYKDAVFLTIGTGIGGGYIYDEKIIVPKTNPGFEFGHMIIEKDGRECNCGSKGCFETYCSIKRLREKVRAILGLDESVRGHEIVEYIQIELEKNNQLIKDVIEKYTDYLAIGLSNIINLLEPEVISIGGSFVHYSHFLLPLVEEKIIEKGMLFNKRDKINIILAQLKNDAGMIGASML